MIGDFRYEERPSDAGVIVDLSWIDGEPHAAVRLTADVHNECNLHGLPTISEQAIRLPFALATAIIVAGLCEAEMCLTGNRQAWPVQWGALRLSN